MAYFEPLNSLRFLAVYHYVGLSPVSFQRCDERSFFALFFESHTTVVGSTPLSKSDKFAVMQSDSGLLEEFSPAGISPAGYTY